MLRKGLQADPICYLPLSGEGNPISLPVAEEHEPGIPVAVSRGKGIDLLLRPVCSCIQAHIDSFS